VHVHDLVDFVVEESEIAGKAAAEYVTGSEGGASFRAQRDGGPPAEDEDAPIRLLAGEGVKYVVPQRLNGIDRPEPLELFLRVNRVYGHSRLEVDRGGQIIKRVKRLRMNPGEMERLRLDRGAMERSSGSQLVVGAVEEDR
jgi:hypothetical protein